jgi:hypothetical protein
VRGIDYIPELLRSRGYIIMEKISGQSILNLVLDDGPLGENQSKHALK